MEGWREGYRKKLGYWADGWIFELMDGGIDDAGTGNGWMNKSKSVWMDWKD